jgi:hypothetical protein
VRALRKNPQFAKDVFAYVENDVIMPYLQAQAAGAHLKSFSGADAWTAFPVLSLSMTREWVFPSADRLKAMGKQRGWDIQAAVIAGDYCEEDPAKFDKQQLFACLDMMNEHPLLGMRMAQAIMGRTQDWDPHWLQEFAISRGRRGKLPITFGINGRFMRDSKPEVIAERVRGWIDVMGREGKFLMSVSNIPADTQPVNIFTLLAAMRTYGRYPIAKDLGTVPFHIPAFPAFDDWLKGQPEEEVIRKARE